MRRKDREITDPAEMAEIIRSARLMRIALVDGDWPFLVPVFYGYDGTHLYFHGAQQGQKVDLIRKNPNIAFEISVDHGIIEDAEPCDFEAKHRTVIGRGKASFLSDPQEKAAALDLIVAKFTPKKFEYPASKLEHTGVVKIEVVALQGKKHGV